MILPPVIHILDDASKALAEETRKLLVEVSKATQK